MEKVNGVFLVKAGEMSSFFLHCETSQAVRGGMLNSLNILQAVSEPLMFDFNEYLQYLDKFYSRLDDTKQVLLVNNVPIEVHVKGIVKPSQIKRLLASNATENLYRVFMGDISLLLGMYTMSTLNNSLHVRWTGCSVLNNDMLSSAQDILLAGSPNTEIRPADWEPLQRSLSQRISLLRTYSSTEERNWHSPTGILALSTYARFASGFRESYPLWNLLQEQPVVT